MMKNKEHTGNIFVDKLNYYQSANSDPQSIKANFVIRIHEFDLIIDAIKSKKLKDPLQHELILGRRGSGKSTLLKRIEIEINENKELSKYFIPVNLAEEQAGIYRLSDLWFETLSELQLRSNDYIELEKFSAFDSNEEYTRYLFDEISHLLSKIKKRAVLLLDNLDRILENLSDDAHLLRELLLNYNNIQIIGGSARMDEHFWRYDQPFYEFFRRHKLGSLSFNEIHTLLNHWSMVMDIPQLKDFAIDNRGKIESIRILTDGLPRTLQFFIKILLSKEEIYGFQYIKKIMDQATPLYQERLNHLTPAQRKIVLEMAFIWEASSTKQLINKCRMEGKLISAYLKQLSSYGIVEKIDTRTKNKLYRISERFFNMWLIITQGNPEQKRKARYLTIFLEHWYEPKDILDLAKQHLDSLKSKKPTYDKAIVLTKAYSQSKHISKDLRDQLIDSTSNLADSGLVREELPDKSSDIISATIKLAENGKYKQAIQKIRQLENEKDGLKFYMLGWLYYKLENNTKAKQFYLKAIKKGDAKAMNNLALLYKKEGNNEKAEFFYLKAIKKGNVIAMYNLSGLYLFNRMNPAKALELIKKVIKNSKNQEVFEIELLIRIWNGIFDDLDQKIHHILDHNDERDLSLFIQYLLFLDQKNMVLSYFESEKYGKRLREQHILLYYATMILCSREAEIVKKIPKEVLPTVKDIVQTVQEKNEFYNQ